MSIYFRAKFPIGFRGKRAAIDWRLSADYAGLRAFITKMLQKAGRKVFRFSVVAPLVTWREKEVSH